MFIIKKSYEMIEKGKIVQKTMRFGLAFSTRKEAEEKLKKLQEMPENKNATLELHEV